jgi:hypothetical protein
LFLFHIDTDRYRYVRSLQMQIGQKQTNIFPRNEALPGPYQPDPRIRPQIPPVKPPGVPPGKPPTAPPGKPPIGIDIDGDGKPDIFVTPKPGLGIDIDGDGKPDIVFPKEPPKPALPDAKLPTPPSPPRSSSKSNKGDYSNDDLKDLLK